MTGNSLLLKARKLAPLVVIAAGLLAYHNSFTGAFIDDDFGSILENPTIRHLWPIWQCLSPPHRDWLTVEGRPLINLSLAISYALSGYNVWGYHIVNLAVHILAGLTLFGVVRRTLRRPGLRDRFGAEANELAMAAAVLWTVHPLQVESVTYIIERAESIMGLFYLLTLYCFICGVESPPAGNGKWSMGNGSWRLRGRLWYGLSVAACALGMASKEVMVTAPVVVMLYDRAFVSGSFREAWGRRRFFYLALAGTWIVLGYVLVSSGTFAYASTHARFRGVAWWEYLATEPGVMLYYLRLCVWPSPLCMNHPWPIARTWGSILPAAVAVAMLVGASVWAWRRKPVWGFVGAWLFLILAPSSSIIAAIDPLYEHRMYLSLAAVVCVVVMGLYSLMGRRSLAVFAVAAVGLGFLTWRRNQDYRSEVVIRTDGVTKFPDYPQAHYNLGDALRRAGRFPEAIGQYEQVLRAAPNYAGAHYHLGDILLQLGKLSEATRQYEQAIEIKPDLAEAHYNLGVALTQANRTEEAIGQFEEALRLKPDYTEAYYNLGLALVQIGRPGEAIQQYERALQVSPGYAEAHNNLGIVLAQVGRTSDAIGHYQLALRLKPDLAEAHYNLGAALMRLGRVQEAVEQWEQTLRLRPDYAEVHYNLGLVLAREGRVPEAIDHWEQALRLKPSYAEAHVSLGVALQRSGKIPEAIGHYEAALRLKPDYVDAHYNLGIALERSGRLGEAIAQYEEALRISPNYAKAHYNLGTALEQTGRVSEAMMHFEQALRINPHMVEAQRRLGHLQTVQ